MMNLTRIAEATGLPLPECRALRIAYLRRHIQEMAECVASLADHGGELEARFAESVFGELVSEARELRYLSRVSRPGYRQPVGNITPEMIERARQFPIENLIEFDRQHKAVAFCHADNHPSLSWHRAGNRATCFPCNKSFNPIDVLTLRDGMSFRDAVRQLSH